MHTLSDFDRKLLIIVQHESRKGTSPSLAFLKKRTGRSEWDIRNATKSLIKQGWLKVKDKQLKIAKNVF